MTGRPPEILVGTTGFGSPPSKFPAALRLVEIEQTFRDNVQGRTLRRWRRDVHDGVHFAVRAHQDVTWTRSDAPGAGHLRASEEVDAGWRKTVDAATAVEASAVVLRTPASFTPTRMHRDALLAFAERAAEDLPGTIVAWEPRGLWELDDIGALCTEAGLVASVDPMHDEPPEGAVAFCRLSGSGGGRGRYDPFDLTDILGQLGGFARSYVVFDHPAARKDSLGMASLLDELSAG